MEYMNDYDPKMIGKRIKETAQSMGYTAEKLSEITGNGIHTINRIYQGTSISTEYICQLSQEVSANFLRFFLQTLILRGLQHFFFLIIITFS